MQSFTEKKATTNFDVMRGGKVIETFATYEEAWAHAEKYRGAVVRYYIKRKDA